MKLLFLEKYKHLLHPIDIHFACMLARDDQPILMLAAAFVSRYTREGHVCLPLSILYQKSFFSDLYNDLTYKVWDSFGTLEDIEISLLACSAISDGTQVTPLVLEKKSLYLYRMWRSEKIVAKFIQRKNMLIEIDEKRACVILDYHFREQDFLDWQKVAVAIMITCQIAIISGGPGTGKTTIISKFLCVLLELLQRPQRIKVVAPTGKAAARLTESLNITKQNINSRDFILNSFPNEAITLHRLLGILPDEKRIRYNADNPLPLDILVIDESSMIDVSMMAHLILALPEHARVIFLGDHRQLSSIEAGSVFSDLCDYSHNNYSINRSKQLSRLTGYKIVRTDGYLQHSIADMMCILSKSYRFADSSGISQLAAAVNKGHWQLIDKILNSNFNDICYFPLKNLEDYHHLLNKCVEGYRGYLDLIQNRAKPSKVLSVFKNFQVLCAISEGLFGSIGLNQYIETKLSKMELIRTHKSFTDSWYVGRPVMITRNDSVLKLCNGDIGIAMLNDENKMKVWFLLPDGNTKAFYPFFLPLHNTAFAMTVHKSQGSEFNHILLVLPPQILSVMTRQLVYTAITRAKQKITIFSEKITLQKAINLCISRCSGLLENITNNL
ncbi:exodeoxyribonuclease V subunit alpha [Candidatus Erwinia haradaeae]|nr:exodeoxyribonuclease V subunit alpha [Candidatus Erwinia haradaeae]